MFQQFVDRSEELELLEDLYGSKKAEFIVIYGRRRAGKTELVLKFSEGKPSIYFLAAERRDEDNLKEFRDKVGEFFGDEWFLRVEPKNWVELFKYLSEKIGEEKTAILIDEFPYLVKQNPGVPSAFQKAWDTYLKHQKVMLVVIGSSISMMEKLLGYKSPIYGRRTAQLEIRPLRFRYINYFLPGYAAADLVRVYSCVGGIPFYLEQFDNEKTFLNNVQELFLRRGRFLYEEAEFLLRQEFRQPANYFSILKAIAFGYLRFGEIVGYTGLDRSIVSKYIDNLAQIRVVRKSHPVLSRKEKSRDRRYVVADNYYRFWFRFIYPHKTLIEENRGDEVLVEIKREIDAFVGTIFEDVAAEFLWAEKKSSTLPLDFKTLGGWWHRGEEIDLVALNDREKEMAFFEVKWSSLRKRDTDRILRDLERKASLVKWHNTKRKEHYGIVARRIAIPDKHRLREQGVLAYDLRDIEETIRKRV